MNSRKKILEARDAAKAFIKAVDAWEKAHSLREEELSRTSYMNKDQFDSIKDRCGFGNRHSGEVKAQSLILTRRLADMRR